MKEKIKVSVIVPIYNASEYLKQCLDTLINQTLKEIEIICVNDGSTDDTLLILNEYKKIDNRIRVISQENKGAGAARNVGLDVAKGEYLMFLDADDFFELELLEKMYEKAVLDNSDFVVCKSNQYYTCDNEFNEVNWVVRDSALPPYMPFNKFQMTDNIFKVFVGWAWDKLFSRNFVNRYKLRFQEQRTSDDLLFVFSALVVADRISLVDKILVHQRRDSKESLSKTREKSWHCFYDALCELRKFIIKVDLYDYLKKDYINYAVHFSLWNIKTLAEPTKSKLIKKMKNEWLKDLEILDKDVNYFYNKGEYLDLMSYFL